MHLTSFLFRLARLSADAKTVASGDAGRMGRRAKNKLVGRALARAGLWRRLWR
jgi:muconolactone delta-isomerase